MIVFPAIDLLGGRVVRLRRGDYDAVTAYEDDPIALATTFSDQGATHLHVVDLEGARVGRPVHLDTVTRIVDATDLWVQVGGGLRSRDAVQAVLKAGAKRVILGTAAIQDVGFAESVCSAFPGQVAVSLDADEGRIKIAGWTVETRYTLRDLVDVFGDIGVSAFVVTDIGRDGTLEGYDPTVIDMVLSWTDVPVVAAGGVSSIEDIRALRPFEDKGLEGVIVGKALYEGRVSIKQLMDEAC